MKILAFETATAQGSIALIDEHKLIAEYSLNIKSTHSERLMPALRTILSDTETKLKQVDALAISLGPGSFTGLRIGLATVKGLSFSTGKPIIGIPTLEAMAGQFAFAKPLVCPCLDARKGEIYTALYDLQKGSPDGLIPATVTEPSKFLQAIKMEHHAPILFLGDGVEPYRSQIVAILGEQACFAPLFANIPRAGSLAVRAVEKYCHNLFDDITNLEPIYLRKSEAEIKWLKKQAQSV